MRPWLTLIAAVNPAAVARSMWPRERLWTMVLAATSAAVIAVVGAWASGPVLDAIDVSAPTFHVATALVIGIAGARAVAVGAPHFAADERPNGRWRVLLPVLFPALVTPQLLFASISIGASDGVGPATTGAITALALATIAAVVEKQWAIGWDAAVRFLGAASIALALALAVDGVKAI